MIDWVHDAREYLSLTTVDDSMAKMKEVMDITLPITSGLLAMQTFWSWSLKNLSDLQSPDVVEHSSCNSEDRWVNKIYRKMERKVK